MAIIQVDGRIYRVKDATVRSLVAGLPPLGPQDDGRARFMRAACQEADHHKAAFRALGHERPEAREDGSAG